jgi:SnoaL-like domain
VRPRQPDGGAREFAELLETFVRAVEANDGKALAAAFTPDGVYDDGFYGAHVGRDSIADMLGRFHATGRDFRWEFSDPVREGAIAYARYCFSYRSRLAESIDRPVVFEGMSQFRLRDGLITQYSEVFDRGLALAQLGFPAERIGRSLARYVERQNVKPGCLAHLARLRHPFTGGEQ